MNTLSQEDYTALMAAVSSQGRRVLVWYSLPNSFQTRLNIDDIVSQTEARTDYEVLQEVRPEIKRDKFYMELKDYHLKAELKTPRSRFRLSHLIGKKDREVLVFNPRLVPETIRVGKNSAKLIQIDGLNRGNVLVSTVNFEERVAVLEEYDQDLAHRLNFEYTPVGVLETDALTPSDFRMHTNKPKESDNGRPILYCDNRGCQRTLRSPTLIFDPQTGGLYHSMTCFGKDMGLKVYLASKNLEISLAPNPIRVSLEHAVKLYQSGRLLQSQEPVSTIKFRSLSQWPEAAIVLPH